MFDWLKHIVRDKFPSAEDKKNREFQRLLAIPNKTAEDCANLAWHYQEKQQLQESNLWITRGLEMDGHPSDARILSQAASLYHDLGDFEKAIKYHEQTITLLDPISNKDRLYAEKCLLSVDYLNVDDALHAKESLESIFTSGECDIFIIKLYVHSMILLGDFSKCLIFLHDQLKKHPENPEVLVALGDFHFQHLFDPETALSYFDQAASIVFKSYNRKSSLFLGSLFHQIMWSLLATGQMEDAKDIVDFAYTKRKIDREEYLVILTNFYSDVEDIPSMDRTIQQIHRLKKPSDFAISSITDALLAHDRKDEILDEITRLHQEQPSNYFFACSYTKLKIANKEYTVALNVVKDHIQTYPQPDEATNLLGVCYLCLEETQSALYFFTILSRSDPNNREPRMAAAVCQKKLGHLEIAQQILTEIKSLPRNYWFQPEIIAAFSEAFPGEYSEDTFLSWPIHTKKVKSSIR
jgi:tetratricopeptide (TPR) repeat protein